jgi:xanthosine utilization system XapX-like protein
MKFLGVSFVVTLVVGSLFAFLAADSSRDGPLIIGILGSIIIAVTITVQLFKYVNKMVTEQHPKTTD